MSSWPQQAILPSHLRAEWSGHKDRESCPSSQISLLNRTSPLSSLLWLFLASIACTTSGTHQTRDLHVKRVAFAGKTRHVWSADGRCFTAPSQQVARTWFKPYSTRGAEALQENAWVGLQSVFANSHNKDVPHALGCVPHFPVAAKAPLGPGCPASPGVWVWLNTDLWPGSVGLPWLICSGCFFIASCVFHMKKFSLHLSCAKKSQNSRENKTLTEATSNKPLELFDLFMDPFPRRGLFFWSCLVSQKGRARDSGCSTQPRSQKSFQHVSSCIDSP